MKDSEQMCRVKHIVEKWFLLDSFYFQIAITHQLVENEKLKVPIRTGQMRIEISPKLISLISDSILEQLLRIEITRIILQHPYSRMPLNCNLSALGAASDVTIADCCPDITVPIQTSTYYNLGTGLCFEEYYEKLKYLVSPVSNCLSDGEGLGEESSDDKKRKSEMLEKCFEFTSDNYAEKSGLWQEDEESSEEIKEIVKNAIDKDLCGKLSGKLMELVEATLVVQIDYRSILRTFRSNIRSSQFNLTRMRPSRRYSFEYMGKKSRDITKLLVGVDVSGSISSDDLKNFFSIINRFFKYDVSLIEVIPFDYDLKEKITLKKATKEINVTGRGGTNFSPILDFYCNEYSGNGLIIFTDGLASFPVMEQEKRILWIFNSKSNYETAEAQLKKYKLSKATWIPSV